MTASFGPVPGRRSPMQEWRAGLAAAGVDLAEFDREAMRRAREWMAATDGSVRVGDRHHTVPRFYIAGFGDADGRVRVRNRVGGAPSRLDRPENLAQKDFYTTVDEDGTRSALLEDILGQVEGMAAPVVEKLRTDGGPLDADERQRVALLLSLQIVRGPRHRREVELQVEYAHKLMGYADPRHAAGQPKGASRGNGRAAQRLAAAFENPESGLGVRLAEARRRTSASKVARSQVVSDPNWHVKFMAVAQELHPALADRPPTVVRLTGPLLVTGDEPVVLVGGEDDAGAHGPDCHLSAARRRRRHRDAARRGEKVGETIHLRKVGHVGVAVAEEVWFPLSPDRLLVLGPRGGDAPATLDLGADDSLTLAREVNDAVATRSHLWVVARPDHPTFEADPMPLAGPLIVVCDGGTPMSRSLLEAPSPHMPHRRGAQDVLRRAAGGR